MKSTQEPASTTSEKPATIAMMIAVTSHQNHSALPGIGIRAPAGH